MLKKRPPRGSVMLCLCTLLIAFCACLMLGNLYRKNELYKDVRGFYTQYGRRLVPAEGLSLEALEKALARDTGEGVVLYKTALESLNDTRGVFTKGASQVPPMRRGRFFDAGDYGSQKRVAVVGNFFEKDIQRQEGKDQIPLLGETFEVVGVMGRAAPSRLDTMIWIPLDTAIALTGAEGSYVIDGPSAKSVQKDLAALDGLMKIRMDSYNGEIIESSLADISGAWDTTAYVYLAALLSFLIATVFASAYWLAYRRTEAYVKRLNGYSPFTLLRSLLRRYLWAVLPFAAAGSALALAAQRLLMDEALLGRHLLMGMLLALAPGVTVVLLLTARLSFKREIQMARGL